MNVIDLVAILPFFISFLTDNGGSVSIVRVLRLARMLRIFKIGNLKQFVLLMNNTVKKSVQALGVLLFFAFLGVILFASIIFFFESGTYEVSEMFPNGAYVRWNMFHSSKEESPFSSILVSCYWAVVTSTTTGFGDLYPTSPMGRFIAVILMYLGILIIALPVGVVGSAFTKEYENMISAEKDDTDGANEDMSDDDAYWNEGDIKMHQSQADMLKAYRNKPAMIHALSTMSMQINAMLLILQEGEVSSSPVPMTTDDIENGDRLQSTPKLTINTSNSNFEIINTDNIP
jgi:hypothetical protein